MPVEPAPLAQDLFTRRVSLFINVALLIRELRDVPEYCFFSIVSRFMTTKIGTATSSSGVVMSQVTSPDGIIAAKYLPSGETETPVPEP